MLQSFDFPFVFGPCIDICSIYTEAMQTDAKLLLHVQRELKRIVAEVDQASSKHNCQDPKSRSPSSH